MAAYSGTNPRLAFQSARFDEEKRLWVMTTSHFRFWSVFVFFFFSQSFEVLRFLCEVTDFSERARNILLREKLKYVIKRTNVMKGRQLRQSSVGRLLLKREDALCSFPRKNHTSAFRTDLKS